MFLISGINTLVKSVGKIIDSLHTSQEEKDAAKLSLGKLQHGMVQDALTFEIEQVKAQSAIIIAEAKAGWLTSNWRPMLMVTFMAMLINNYIVYPYTYDLDIGTKMLEFPPEMWSLLKLGVGGYIGGRTAEKIIPSAISKWQGSFSEKP